MRSDWTSTTRRRRQNPLALRRPWKVNGEDAAAAWYIAHPNFTAVCPDGLTRDREPQPETSPICPAPFTEFPRGTPYSSSWLDTDGQGRLRTRSRVRATISFRCIVMNSYNIHPSNGATGDERRTAEP